MGKDSEPVGELIRRARRRQGMSQDALAKSAGVPRSWIAAVEVGQVNRPDIDRLRNIAAAMNQHADDFIAAAGYQAAMIERPRTIVDVARELLTLAEELESKRKGRYGRDLRESEPSVRRRFSSPSAGVLQPAS